MRHFYLDDIALNAARLIILLFAVIGLVSALTRCAQVAS